MNEQTAERLLTLMQEVHSSLKDLRLQPWANDLMVLAPANPLDFAHYVHFVEGLCAVYSRWLLYLHSQGTHNPHDLQRVGSALTALATEARMAWEAYKEQAGIQFQVAC